MSVSASVPQRILDSVDESPVVAYVKDLDGRYLHVNQRYQEFLAVGSEDVCGRTDHELGPRQTIDGPRLASGGVSEDEPLQLEYTVPSFEGRPALAVWRFAVRADTGDAVAVCGVAAPVADAALARRECDRLMTLAQEPAQEEPSPVEQAVVPQADDDRITSLHEASASVARRAHELLSELTEERERRAEAETRAAESDELRRRLEAADGATVAERSRADEVVAELHAARGELASVRGRLEAVEAGAQREAARAEEAAATSQRDRARAEEALTELNTARGELASVRGRLEGAEAAAHAERVRAEESLGVARAGLETSGAELAAERQALADLRAQLDDAFAAHEATRAELRAATEELASERTQRTQTEEEVVGELRRRLEETTAELNAARTQLHTAPAGELVEDLRRKLAHAEATAQQERERADAAETAVNSARADAEVRIGVAERRIAELEAALADARAHELELETDRPLSGPQWDSSAQRAFTTALSQSSDWRVSVKSAIGVVGSQGGWDAVCAWQPDDQNGFASCFAMWTGENNRLSALETATWQRRQPLAGSTIGAALSWEESQWLAADPRAADRRLQLLAQHGIRGALIVPVKDGARPVAALELLTVAASEPSRELVDSIETIALQLGHFSQLLSAGAQPRWRFGRM